MTSEEKKTAPTGASSTDQDAPFPAEHCILDDLFYRSDAMEDFVAGVADKVCDWYRLPPYARDMMLRAATCGSHTSRSVLFCYMLSSEKQLQDLVRDRICWKDRIVFEEPGTGRALGSLQAYDAYLNFLSHKVMAFKTSSFDRANVVGLWDVFLREVSRTWIRRDCAELRNPVYMSKAEFEVRQAAARKCPSREPKQPP